MQNECWQHQFCVTRIFLVNYKFSFPKPVNQVRFNKTIKFLRLSRLETYFHDIKHAFHSKKHFFVPKSTKKQKLLKIMQNSFWQDQFCVSRIFLVNWEFSFPKRLLRFSLPKQQYFGDFHDFKKIFMTSSTLFIAKSTFSYQKAQKNKSCSKSCKTIFGRNNFVLRVYIWPIVSFPFQTG